MKPSLVIADFSGVYAEDGFLQELQERGVPYRLVGLGDIEGTTCYCDPDAEAEINRRLVPEPAERMRWIDSGDYHYVTGILAAREQVPFTLVLVDNHPDDQPPAFGGVLSCGGWVRALRDTNPMLEEVWTLGPDHRIRNASGTVDRELEERIDDLMADLAGKRVYLSIDKDVLDRKWARTDWNQGTYSLAQLEAWLDHLLRLDVVAVDVCGELSIEKGATPEDLRVNCETNIELQEFILDYLK
jgi:arginase family enzyme